MAEPKQNPNPNPPAQPQPQQSAPRRATPTVFGDGSTKEQQDQLVRAAKEANAEVKKYADAERDARSG